MNKRDSVFRIFSLASIALIALASCDVPFEPEASRDFVISEGQHYATPRLYETFHENKLAFRATFDESAKYNLGDASLQSNINKLMGFSDCGAHHHANSARFGWLWDRDQVEIYAYCYVDSVRIHQAIAKVKLNEENLYEIATTESAYVFFINGEKKAAIEKGNVCADGVRYMLYPYFGGSAPAPHDVRVAIEMVD